MKSRHLMAAAYSVISTPRAGDLEHYGGKGPFNGSNRLGAHSNVGYQQAMFNLATMKRAGLQSRSCGSTLSRCRSSTGPRTRPPNAAVVRGAAKGYTDAGYKIGAYSTQALWQHVVGDLRLEFRSGAQRARPPGPRLCGGAASTGCSRAATPCSASGWRPVAT